MILSCIINKWVWHLSVVKLYGPSVVGIDARTPPSLIRLDSCGFWPISQNEEFRIHLETPPQPRGVLIRNNHRVDQQASGSGSVSWFVYRLPPSLLRPVNSTQGSPLLIKWWGSVGSQGSCAKSITCRTLPRHTIAPIGWWITAIKQPL